MATEAQRAGNRLEDKTQDALKLMESVLPARMYRYPDKKAAKYGYATSAPADYGLLLNGHHHRIECKASVTHLSLTECFKKTIQDHQMTAARKQIRAGGTYWILFASELNYTLELWDAAFILEPFSTPRMKIYIADAAAVLTYTKTGVQDILMNLTGED